MTTTIGQVWGLLKELVDHDKHNQLDVVYADTAENGHEGGPYPWQQRFHDAGDWADERAIIAANQTGKTRTAGIEVAIHATGRYPKWWKGHRFPGPIEAGIASESNEVVRNVQQKELLGPMAEGERVPDGTGWIPKECIGTCKFRKTGVDEVLDYIKIKHISGGWSTLFFKSYEMKAGKFQAVKWHLAWLDEEPDDYRIFSEVETRLLTLAGILIFTRTPLFGMTKIVRHFMSRKPGVFYVGATWDDAPHLSDEQKEKYLDRFPENERDTRTKGLPMVGSGRVYRFDDQLNICEPFRIPDHFRRLAGIDFGMRHAGAVAWGAHDVDTDTLYIYQSYRQPDQIVAYHVDRLKSCGAWIPVAWPHDGERREWLTGVTLKNEYLKGGANMLPLSARLSDDTGGSQGREAITQIVADRLRTGRLKIWATERDLIEELRMLHRENGKIVPTNDDLESALRYLVMMIRYATTESEENDLDMPMRNRAESEYDPLSSMSACR